MFGPVILSGVAASRSEGDAEPKDPYKLYAGATENPQTETLPPLPERNDTVKPLWVLRLRQRIRKRMRSLRSE